MKYTKLKKDELVKGCILEPNGSTKQSCNNVFKSDNIEVEFIKPKSYGNEIYVKIIKGSVKHIYTCYWYKKGESITVNLNHFKLINSTEDYAIF